MNLVERLHNGEPSFNGAKLMQNRYVWDDEISSLEIGIKVGLLAYI